MEEQPSPAKSSLIMLLGGALVLLLAITAVVGWQERVPEPAPAKKAAQEHKPQPDPPQTADAGSVKPTARVNETVAAPPTKPTNPVEPAKPVREADEDPAEADEEVDDEADDEPQAFPRRPRESPGEVLLSLDSLPPGAIVLRDQRTVWLPKRKELWLPGKIVQNDVMIEYFACFRGGKDHESIVEVHADPMIVNTGLILLGLKEGGVDVRGDAALPLGDPLHLLMEWLDADGVTQLARAEELILSARSGRPMRRIPWIYTGSRFVRDPDTGRSVYMAAIDRVFVAVYRDPHAIINNPLPEGADDESYIAHTKRVPPIDTRVKLIVRQAPKKEYEQLLQEIKQQP